MPFWMLAAILFVLLSGFAAAAFIRVLWRQLHDAVQRRFPAEAIVRLSPTASFLGQKSRGMRQIRGNGMLVLTRDALWFMRALPRKEYAIPIGDITEVTTPRTFLGKSIIAPLLCVAFDGPNGPDAIAWAVRDLDQWAEDIERFRGEHSA